MQRHDPFGSARFQRSGLRGELHAPNSVNPDNVFNAELADFGHPRPRIGAKPRHPTPDRIDFLERCLKHDCSLIFREAALCFACIDLKMDYQSIGRVSGKPAIIDRPLQNGSDRGEFRIPDRLRPQARLDHLRLPGNQILGLETRGHRHGPDNLQAGSIRVSTRK